MALSLDWMPEPASTWAEKVDFLNNFITWVSVFCTIAITGAMVFMGIKYRRRSDNDETPNITHNATLETVWTVVPTLVVIFIFYYGTMVYVEERTPPVNPIEIGVRGYQWAWEFTYPTGKKEAEQLVVPLGKPVKLIMKSDDVNHSFFIPSMRVKEDVIGGTYHYMWFQATKPGEFPIFCAEYCGTNHSGMLAKLKVVSEEEYEDHIQDRRKGEMSPEEFAKQVYVNKGCKGCHSIDGTAVVGPTFKGLYGREETMQDGLKVTVDENYIRESILNPTAKIVKGYQPVMPSMQPTDEEINAVIAWLKGMK